MSEEEMERVLKTIKEIRNTVKIISDEVKNLTKRVDVLESNDRN